MMIVTKDKSRNELTEAGFDQVLTVQQAADFLNFSPSTIYKLVSGRKIPYSKRNGSVRFLKSSLIQWLKDGEKKVTSL